MRTLYVLAIASFLAGCASTGTIYRPRVNATYDSVEGRTMFVSSTSILRNHGIGGAPAITMETAAMCPGDVRAVTGPPCPSPRFFVGFNKTGDHLATSDGATIRIGERRIRPEPAATVTDTQSLRTFREVNVYEFSADDFRDFVMAPDGEVEARVIGETVQISAPRREGARMLYARMTGTSAP